ncbi:hypothetical protein [Bradyrhizobium sp. USDA 4452]
MLALLWQEAEAHFAIGKEGFVASKNAIDATDFCAVLRVQRTEFHVGSGSIFDVRRWHFVGFQVRRRTVAAAKLCR